MKTKTVRYPKRRTLRLSEAEDINLTRAASVAGLSVSAFLRRKCFGGRPIISRTDAEAIRELRRLGGLLKHHFTAVREVTSSVVVEELCSTLKAVQKTIEHLGKP